MKIKTFLTGILAIGGLAMASGASAAPFDATTKTCPGSSTFIATNNVTADGSNAAGCYGVFDGNDPGPSGDGISIGGGTVLEFISKTSGGAGENPLGLTASGGNWSFSSDVTFDGTWMFVIKQGNCWAGWTFGGGTYSGGTYVVTFGTQMGECALQDPDTTLSHVAIYGTVGDTEVPEPATLGLLGLGLLGIGLARRRRARG